MRAAWSSWLIVKREAQYGLLVKVAQNDYKAWLLLTCDGQFWTPTIACMDWVYTFIEFNVKNIYVAMHVCKSNETKLVNLIASCFFKKHVNVPVFVSTWWMYDCPTLPPLGVLRWPSAAVLTSYMLYNYIASSHLALFDAEQLQRGFKSRLQHLNKDFNEKRTEQKR